MGNSTGNEDKKSMTTNKKVKTEEEHWNILEQKKKQLNK